MNSQNILKFYGSKLDLKLDSSELYDFEMGGVENDYDISLLDFTTSINYDSLVIDSDCLTGNTVNEFGPWIIDVGVNYTGNTCDFTVRNRTELGWTIDMVFNKNGGDWSNGKTFYFLGVQNETHPQHYYDNNLLFRFTTSGQIEWQAVRYSGYCDSNSGFTETFYTDTDQTNIIPTGITSNDFNVTITFERYSRYDTTCDIANEGGVNDLVTGVTILNAVNILTGDTEQYVVGYGLNEIWSNERFKRLGRLKIYINGVLFYKKENWEEVIPKLRDNSTLVQKYGVGYSNNSATNYIIKRVKYFEEPLNFLQLNHHYMVDILPNYDVPNNSPICEFGADDLIGYTDQGLLTEIEENLLTEDNNILLY